MLGTASPPEICGVRDYAPARQRIILTTLDRWESQVADARDALGELTSSLLGQQVAFTRVAGNSLLLYVGFEPGGPESNGIVVWFNPPWHVAGPSGVTIGSYPLSVASHDGGEVFERACAPAELLRGQTITRVAVDDCASELSIAAGEFVVRSFVDDPDDSELWQIHDRAGGRRLFGGAPGLTLG
jgi:hypothetical protein